MNDGGTNWLEYVYARRTDPGSGLAYWLELSEDLRSWSTGGYTETGTGLIDAHFVAVTNRVPFLTTSNRFVRLRVSCQ